MTDKIARWIAWKLPRPVLKWSFYRILAAVTSGRWSKTSPLGMSWETIMNRWDKADGPCCTHQEDTCDESCDCGEWCCPPEGIPLEPEATR